MFMCFLRLYWFICVVLLGAPPSFGSTLRGSSTEEQRHLLSSSSSSKQEGDHAHIRRTEARPILQNQRRNVVGGQPATESEAPFYVALIALVGNTYQFQKCGGSLLSSRHVMTAAHCLENRLDYLNHGIEAVAIGAHTMNSTGGFSLSYFSRSVSYVFHPNYTSSSLLNDVAIITLETPISLSDLASTHKPVSLVTEDVPDNTTATVYGLGQTNVSSTQQVETLQKVDVPFRVASYCQMFYGRQLDPDSMVCAGFLEGGKDACNGDSGGPLMVSESMGNEFPEQVGIVSWGKGCGGWGKLGVYTRVSHIRPWVQSVVCGSLPDPAETGFLPLCGGTGVFVTESLTPSTQPSVFPSVAPSSVPSFSPTGAPSQTPSSIPSQTPSSTPSQTPSYSPSQTPSSSPSQTPSSIPSQTPSFRPSVTAIAETASMSDCIRRGGLCSTNGPPYCDDAQYDNYCKTIQFARFQVNLCSSDD